MKKNGIALAIILIILVMTLVACGENDLDTCEHNVVIDEAVSATCTEMGLTEGAHCSKCGEVLLAQTEVPALGHTAADAVKENEIAPTCTTAGSYDSVVYCFVCDAELSRETKSVDALDHNIVNHNAQAPTCTEVGWEAYEACSRCDYTTYVEIPATGHNHVPAVTVPTCTEKGYTTYTCHCGDTYIADEVPATGHSPLDAVKEKEIAPECTTKGSYDSVVYCSVCNNELSRETKSVDALDHNIVNHNAQAPTCTEVGWEAYEACSRCDYTTYVEIPATGHNHVPAVTVPTCTEKGYTTYTCHCGDTYIADEVPATGHNFENNEYCLICSAEYYTEGLQFSLCNDEYTVTGIITSASDVTIPSTYNGKPVTIIDNYAFQFCTGLTSIVIPESVTTIGKGAFYDCDSLTSIVIPASVTTIGDRAFYDCRNLTSIVIPASVTSIGELAFIGSNVTDVYYNGDVAGWCGISFGDASANPMYYADNLYIDGKLVEGELVIPDSVTTIPINAFRGCDVTSVTFGNESQLTAIDSFAFAFCYSLISVTIPDGVTSIGNNAFFSCDNLTNVTFGNDSQLLEIGSFAFAHCYKLSVFHIPAGVINIDDCAFYYCNYLSSVTIPAGMTSIGEEAFRYCDRLKSIYNYSTLEIVAGETTHGYIAEYAEHIYDMTGDATLTEDEDGFVLYTKGNVCELIEYKGDATDVVIPDGTTAINSSAFYDNDAIGMVFIPDGVTSIGNNAFLNCYNLTSVTFGNESQLTTIGSYAFCNCYSLANIVIPDSLITIGNYAFYDCDGLSSVTIPAGMTSIGVEAFRYCDRLKSIYNYSTLEIVAGETTHGYIAEYAEHIYDMTGDATLTEDEDGFVLYTKGNVCELIEYKGDATDVVIPDGTTAINCNAFDENDTIETVYIPNGVTSIGSYAFYNCDSLTSIVIPDSVTTIGSSAFEDCARLTVTFGENSQLTTIGSSAFAYCSSLTNVTFGENSRLTTIGLATFEGCGSLTSIVIPDSVTTIGNYAFDNCYSLTSIVIPDSVTTIGSYSFSNCTGLTDVYYEGTEEEWNSIAIDTGNDALYNATIHYNYVNE